MRTSFSGLRVLAALAMILIMIVPSLAHADYSSSSASYIDDCNKNMQANLSQFAQAKSMASAKIFTGIPPVDARLYSCLTSISAAFSINATLSNPFSLLGTLARQAILAILDQVCQMILSDINALKQSALSIFNLACIPIPNLNLGLGGLNLNSIPCNGVNLLQPKITTGPNAVNPGFWQIWGKRYN
jgi:hypothetical protein